MASVTITKSTGGTYFSITNPTGSPAVVYPMNSVSMSTNGNQVTLFNMYTGLPIFQRNFGDVINGDTSSAFANLAALQTYITTNFFK